MLLTFVLGLYRGIAFLLRPWRRLRLFLPLPGILLLRRLWRGCGGLWFLGGSFPVPRSRPSTGEFSASLSAFSLRPLILSLSTMTGMVPRASARPRRS